MIYLHAYRVQKWAATWEEGGEKSVGKYYYQLDHLPLFVQPALYGAYCSQAKYLVGGKRSASASSSLRCFLSFFLFFLGPFLF